jgi:XisH protein
MARDKYHYIVRQALENDGWVITDDPLQLPMGNRKAFIDLGAERVMIGAQKGNEKIAVEIKTFEGVSDIQDLDQALGQFLRYRLALSRFQADRILFLAIPVTFFERFFQDVFFLELLEVSDVSVLIYDELNSMIKKWIK